MITLRKHTDRGRFDHGWLKTCHSFSFGEYYDPAHMGFAQLRVINEDWIEAAAGFPTHGHRDMEIITYVLAGAVAHRDSTGGEGIIRPGEVQRMSAGRGIRHSEFNGLKDQETHLYQIWLLPEKNGIEPSYEQKDFTGDLERGEAVLVASPQAERGSLLIHQDVQVWARRFQEAKLWTLPLSQSRKGWVQVARGECELEGQRLSAGDGAGIQDLEQPRLQASPGAEILFFDMGN